MPMLEAIQICYNRFVLLMNFD